MKRSAVYGIGTGVNGRDAGMQATQRALDQLGSAKPALALVFISQEYQAAEVLSGLTGLLGDTPLWGFTTTAALAAGGDEPRSVLVALITGSELKADVQWFPTFAQDSLSVGRQFLQNLKQEVFLPQDILLAVDGINGSLAPVYGALSELQVNVTGCMAAGDPSLGRTFCVGKNQSGSGALSALILGGRLKIGVGRAHGWQDLGIYFRTTRTRDVWLQTLDGVPAAEAFSKYFGFTPREWAFPPLNEMARLYPLGIEPPPPDPEPKKGTGPFGGTASLSLPTVSPGTGMLGPSIFTTGSLGSGSLIGARPAQPPSMPVGTGPLASQDVPTGPRPFVEMDPGNLLLRSVLRVEIDGSLRMSAPVPENAVAHLMVGDADACLSAAGSAAEQALAGLGGAKPLLVMVLVDVAWQLLLNTRPGQLTNALRTILGDIPIVGAYTFGQLVRPDIAAQPVLHNQNILVVIFAESVE